MVVEKHRLVLESRLLEVMVGGRGKVGKAVEGLEVG